mgnify:CR=1 FL=1
MDDDRGHLITLPLAAEVGAESLLEELQSTLILGHTQQLHGSSLVGSKADDLANDAADKLVVLGDGLGRGKAQIRIWKEAKCRQKTEYLHPSCGMVGSGSRRSWSPCGPCSCRPPSRNGYSPFQSGCGKCRLVGNGGLKNQKNLRCSEIKTEKGEETAQQQQLKGLQLPLTTSESVLAGTYSARPPKRTVRKLRTLKL